MLIANAHLGPTTAPVVMVTGVGVVAAATLAGAWLARGRGDRRQVWFGAAAGALLVIALAHLLPDAWAGAQEAGLPRWLVPASAVASFAANIAICRAGCACDAHEENAGGAASAAALAVHRFLEGTALALTGPVTAAALAVHALGEGMAVGALLRGRRRRLAAWLIVMCAGPAVGVALAGAVPALAVAEPLLLAVAAGVLAQAARISLRAAFRHASSGWRWTTAPAVAVAVSASLTALAVYGAG